MRWTALVPIKAASARKSRLEPHLSAAERVQVTEVMLAHVVGRLNEFRSIGRVVVVSPVPVDAADWLRDEGRGLNEELVHARFAAGPGPILVIHADLPLLTDADLGVLLTAAAACGHAIAPDRHRTGTNAIAVADGAPVAWQFGADSFARHRAILAPDHAVVERPGLLVDCDTHADLLHAEAGGFVRPGRRYAGEQTSWGETA